MKGCWRVACLQAILGKANVNVGSKNPINHNCGAVDHDLLGYNNFLGDGGTPPPPLINGSKTICLRGVFDPHPLILIKGLNLQPLGYGGMGCQGRDRIHIMIFTFSEIAMYRAMPPPPQNGPCRNRNALLIAAHTGRIYGGLVASQCRPLHCIAL